MGVRRILTVGFLVLWLGVGVFAGSGASTSPKKFTKPQEIAWHLSQAATLWKAGQKDGARTHWIEVLRLDPGNKGAHERLKATATEGAKEALVRLSKAKGLTEIAEALDDQSDDLIGQSLLLADRNAIQANSERLRDKLLYSDFEAFIDKNGLGTVVAISPRRAPRLYGRSFLYALSSWIPRLQKSKINVRQTAPEGLNKVDLDVDHNRYIMIDPGFVEIFGPTVGSNIPLQAVYQAGEWRIAPRQGYYITYEFQAQRR